MIPIVLMLSGLDDIGLNVLFVLLCLLLVFSIMFDSCSLDLFGYVVVVWFSLWF